LVLFVFINKIKTRFHTDPEIRHKQIHIRLPGGARCPGCWEAGAGSAARPARAAQHRHRGLSPPIWLQDQRAGLQTLNTADEGLQIQTTLMHSIQKWDKTSTLYLAPS